MLMGVSPESSPSLLAPEERLDAEHPCGFPPQMMQLDGFASFSPLTLPQLFPPPNFPNQAPDVKPIGASGGGEDAEMDDASPTMVSPLQLGLTNMFRFHVTLNAPTAMIRHADEIPVTYLNKGQSYSILVTDTSPTISGPAPVRHRTVICISFDDEQQRRMPATCWRFWMEGRGASEAHQHGGKLRAVECMEATQSAQGKNKSAPAELDTASFSGFSFFWSPGSGNSADCRISVRFNFLSTDFSLSKGAKGMAIRLCAKTEVVDNGSQHSTQETPEICFCKVKIFRDHGAERKLANDAKHIRKAIDRLKERIIPIETEIKGPGTRRLSESATTKAPFRGLASKVPKHKRTLSGSSTSPTGGLVTDKNIQLQIQMLRAMFTSALPTSILHLRGQEQDDPDLYPIHITNESGSTEVSPKENAPWQQLAQRQTTNGHQRSHIEGASLIYPAPRQQPKGHIYHPDYSAATTPVPPLPPTSQGQWIRQPPRIPEMGLQQSDSQHLLISSGQPLWVQKTAKQNITRTTPNWMEVVDIDPSYSPPQVLPPKPGTLHPNIPTSHMHPRNILTLTSPAACFYILHHDNKHDEDSDNDSDTPARTTTSHPYRAVYPMSRDARELTACIAEKFDIDPARVWRVVRVDERRRSILVDDGVVRQIPEGQDMVLRIEEVGRVGGARTWDVSGDDFNGSDDDDAVFDEEEEESSAVASEGRGNEGYYYEFKLLF